MTVKELIQDLQRCNGDSIVSCIGYKRKDENLAGILEKEDKVMLVCEPKIYSRIELGEDYQK